MTKLILSNCDKLMNSNCDKTHKLNFGKISENLIFTTKTKKTQNGAKLKT